MGKCVLKAFGPSRANSDALSDPQIELIQQASEFSPYKKNNFGME
ncbi:MAG: hypothetical protein CM15mP130_1440 [Verrucomicrobiota bacterium]|nr:MAG: hypothetical protein CM15mP130_1440 [Verrucomicrobiota bacterium]